MSHFTRLRTRMTEKDYLIRALTDLGYTWQGGNVEIRGYGGKKMAVEIMIPTHNPGYEIGFSKVGGNYEIIADWWGIKELNKDQLEAQLNKRYAYHATIDKLKEQGFNLVRE